MISTTLVVVGLLTWLIYSESDVSTNDILTNLETEDS